MRVSPKVQLHVYYEKEYRSWCAYYTDLEGNQIGDAWFAHSRDEVLVFRPPTPEIE